jgi:hypothetical protein
MKSCLRFSLVLMVASTTSCVVISPADEVSIPRRVSPAFDSVSIGGLVFRDERVANRSVGVAHTAGYSQAQTRSAVGMQGLATGPHGTTLVSGASRGQSSSYGTNSSTTTVATANYEGFDNDELIIHLQRGLENANVTSRVIGGAAPIHIEGVVLHAGTSTPFGRVTWNVFSSITLLVLLGAPILGTSESTVELRVYAGDRFLRSYTGHGSAHWRAHYGFAFTVPEGRADSRRLAARLALEDAISQLASTPPH